MSRSHSLSRRCMPSLRGWNAIAAACMILAISPGIANAAIPSFTFSGAGFGHGIGLSQYGAKAYAERGESGAWIIGHYFPGTALKQIAGKKVTVNLDPAADYARSHTGYNGGYAAKSWKVRPGWAGMGVSINGRAPLPDSAGPFTFETSSTRVKVTDKDGRQVAGSPFAGAVTVTMTGSTLPALLQVMGRSGPFKSSSSALANDVRYRGALVIRSNGSRLKLLNQLPMESYLYGVVPRESPSSWSIEALKAQAIAARSYAGAGGGELYCDARSQVYGGYSHGPRSADASLRHEASRTNSAVDATAAKYVIYGGNVVATYFSASSGGYTANKVDIWGGAFIPYLRGVPDPYGSGSYDPWSKPPTFGGMQLAAAIAHHISGEPAGAGKTVYIKTVSIAHTWPDGFAKSVSVKWSNGATSSGIGASTWRLALGLKSTKFFSNAQGDRISAGTVSATSVAASKRAFTAASSAKCVVVASVDNNAFAEAACGAALAGVARGPLLLVHKDSVASEVTAEIKRLRPGRIYIVGGTAAVSSGVESQLRALAPTVRMGGRDRYETSALVARRAVSLGASPTKVVLASGTVWRDASIAAGLAGGSNRPLLLTPGSKLAPAAASALKAFKTRQTLVVGGGASLSTTPVNSVLAITKEKKPAARWGTTGTFYDMAVTVASSESSWLGFSKDTVYVAPATYLPDALVASALSSTTKRPFVFTSTYTPSPETRAYLSTGHSAIRRVTLIGRPTVIGLACGFRLMSDAY
jgi:stage II sporulation protein D